MKNSNFNRSFIFKLLPFVVVILSTTISFKLGGMTSTGGEVAFVNDPRRLIVLGSAYALGFIVLFNNLQYSFEVIQKQWLYLLLLMYVIISLMWSDNSIKVVIGFGHFIGVFVSVMAMTICFKKDRELTFFILSLVFSFTLVLSIIVSVINPAIGLHFVTGRWQGVAGNPNTLGAVCIIAMWINTILFLITKSKIKKATVIMGAVFSVIALFGARSMTSVLVTFAMVFGIYLLSTIEHNSKSSKILISIFSFMVVAIFILVIASLVQILEITIRRTNVNLYNALGIYLPLITTNCAVLGVTFINVDQAFNLAETVVSALGAGVGFTLVLAIMSGIRERLDLADVPKAFKGIPVAFLVAMLLGIAFLAFGGMV